MPHRAVLPVPQVLSLIARLLPVLFLESRFGLTALIFQTYLRTMGVGRGNPVSSQQSSLLSKLYNAETEDIGYLLRAGSSGGAGPKLPMTSQSVTNVAEKYGLNIDSIPININKSIGGVFGQTSSDGTISLYRNAFTNEERLARTLAHEIFHVDQISDNGYPKSVAEFRQYEADAQEYENEWWESVSGS